MSSYEGIGANILTGAVIFSTFFLLVAVLASTSPNAFATPNATTATAVEKVVAAPHGAKVS